MATGEPDAHAGLDKVPTEPIAAPFLKQRPVVDGDEVVDRFLTPPRVRIDPLAC